MRNNSKNIIIKHEKNGEIENYVLYSYGKKICVISGNIKGGNMIDITIGKYWDFSITTRKHLYDFLRDFDIDINNKNVVENAIENGCLENEIPFYYDGGME